jgi:hypothetical protein
VSDQANIRDIQVLGDLKAGFARFSEDVSQVVISIQREFEEIQERFAERQNYWQRQVDATMDAVHEARRTLRECESQPDDEDGTSPDCGCEGEAVEDAERTLATYQDNLETVKQWRHRIEGMISDFQNDLHRLSNLASSRASSAQAFLYNKIEILNRYVGRTSLDNQTANLQRHGTNDIISSVSSVRTPIQPIPSSVDIGAQWKALPPGIYTATLKQVEDRFATSEKRILLFEGFKRGIEALQRAGCRTVFLDGSFVSEKPTPGDFDACWDTVGVDESKLDPLLLDFENFRKRQKEIFRGEFFPSSNLADGVNNFVEFFQVDRDGNKKGIVKIELS